MGQKIVLANFGNGNIGDDAIVLGLTKGWNKEELIVPSKNPKFVEKHYGLMSIKYPSIRFMKEIISSNELIVCGGDMFSENAGFYSRMLPIMLAFCSIIGKKVTYSSIGIYTDSPKFLRLLLRLSMKLSSSASFRDKSSRKIMGMVGEIAGDPATHLIKKTKGKKGDIKKICFCLRHTRNRAENAKIVEVFSKFDKMLTEKSYRTFFVAFETGKTFPNSDNLLFKEIRKERGNLRALFPKTPEEGINVLKGMDVVFSMRYHPLVFADSLKIRCFAIAHSSKILQFAKEHKIEVIGLKQLSEESLAKKTRFLFGR